MKTSVMNSHFALSTFIALGLGSCGSEPSNKNVPETIEQIQNEVQSKSAGDENWAALLTELKMSDIDTASSEKVASSLKVPSEYVTDSTLSQSLATSVGGAIAKKATSSLCASVEAFTAIEAKNSEGLTGAFRFDSGKATALSSSKTLTATVYKMTYKLTGDDNVYAALVTVPDRSITEIKAALVTEDRLKAFMAYNSDSSYSTTINYGYPILLYAHASTLGLGYDELAKSFGVMQLNHIIVAPAFPGVPICSESTDSGACTGTNIMDSIGTKSTFISDPVHLVGVQDCVKKSLLGRSGALATALSDKVLTLNASAANSSTRVLYNLPVSYVVGQGSGATTAQLAVARAAAIAGVLLTTETTGDKFLLKSALNKAGMTTPNLFNCMIANAGQNIFSAGTNKVLLNFWVTGESGFLSLKAKTLSGKIPGLGEMKANIDGLKDAAENATAAKRATAIADYLKQVDPSLNMLLINSGLRNWAKVLKAAEIGASDPNFLTTLKAAKGAGLMLHALGDQVSGVSNTQLISNIYVKASAALAALNVKSPGSGAPGVNWLSLGITAPQGTSSTDTQHGSPAFVNGTAVAPQASCGTADSDGNYSCNSFASNVDPSQYDTLTPAAIVGNWLSKVCVPSLYASKGSGE